MSELIGNLPAFIGIIWLRPMWLWGLLPLLVSTWIWWRQQSTMNVWNEAIDPALQPYVIETGQARRRWSPLALLLGWLLTLVVLAGPVWQQQEVPVFQGQQAQVILFDLSTSMQTDDIKPSRIARARFKLLELLDQASGLQVALIGFSARPYVISPLTDDAATVRAFVPSLSPSIMPVQGSQAGLAINRGVELLAQAGVAQGHLILITDTGVGGDDIAAARAVVESGHRLSVLAVGTQTGAPLRGPDGRFVLDDRGAIVVPQIDLPALQNLAKAGGGIATLLSSNKRDLDALQQLQQQLLINGDISDIKDRKIYWIERGPWLVLLIALGALSLFRRGIVW